MQIPERKMQFLIIPSKNDVYAESDGALAPVKFIPQEDIAPSIENGHSTYQDMISETFCRFPRWFNPALPPVFIPGEVLYRSISQHQNTTPQILEITSN